MTATLSAPDDQSIARLLTMMEGSARFARESVHRAAAAFGPAWEADFAAMLSRFYASESRLQDAVKGYGAFVMDSMRRQKRFEQELSYPAKTYAEAAAEVYYNDDYMRRQYLPGLLLSHYLWTHHYQQIEYFKGFFLPWLERQGVAEFAEVGVGTGIYSRLALQALPALRGTGLDISPLSLEFTAEHVASFGFAPRYQTRRQNILEPGEGGEPLPRFRAVICVEVLEHLEDPVALLRGLRELCTADGKLFVTAALNAAHADHIYLYSRPEEVLAQVEAAGLHLEHSFFANAYAPAKPGLPVPGALAMVLSPKA
ncbi:class I SAM-dependent methyltransferase [Paucibacter sp. M5-1]|uniref:class I SAM-dependent methyltransferase n=1 Tax=Paucibacter sp. M5-1 TaxID=3015998 RepID=UPI00148507C1|nr:class I SAM-dependent methyltransferase [Paucibacter sp. M5-1]MCZ7884806.1 class I SAM-dependent methyltransferase [Paucibacter sp. M5-1]